jgi:hypothetical protein
MVVRVVNECDVDAFEVEAVEAFFERALGGAVGKVEVALEGGCALPT